VESWCTPEEVDALVTANPPTEMLQEYADHATSLLYTLSGRRYRGEATIQAEFEINRRGYASLTSWLPVRNIVSATIGDSEINADLSPAGSYATFDRCYVGRVVTLTLEIGQNPPIMARRAAAALAGEIIRSDSRYAMLPGSDDKRPSSKLSSISRQGVTYTYADPLTFINNNLTGVESVDLFLRAVNPSGARFQPKVVSI
jgi:hypothetical protein